MIEWKEGELAKVVVQSNAIRPTLIHQVVVSPVKDKWEEW
jgi:hypothetical protein